MIHEIHLKNFKSFTDSTFNFSGKNNQPKPIILLYGANGSGKTNFIDVFYCLSCTFDTLNSHNYFMQLLSENNPDIKQERLNSIFSFYRIDNIIKRNKTVDSSSNMRIEISFSLFDKNGTYIIEFDDSQIVYEKLEYKLAKNKGTYYEISTDSEKFSGYVFHEEFLSELKELKKKYWGKHSIFSILTYMNQNYSKDFIQEGYIKSLKIVIDYFNNITCHLVEHRSERNSIGRFDSLVARFEEGIIEEADREKIDNTQDILNYFFTNLYHDINSVFYKTELSDNQKIKYTLYFRKNLSNSIVDINYKMESCGTQSLLRLLPFFIASTYNVVVAIDEIDNGIHDLLLSELICRLLPLIKGQLIITTHNTTFMNNYNLRDYIYAIDISKDYQKTIVPFNDGEYRIQKSSNVVSNYMKGQFGGIPMINPNFDFDIISKRIHSDD